MTIRDLPGFRAYVLPDGGKPAAGPPPGGSADWFSIENKGDKSATVRIYDTIGFWGTSAADFAEQLAELDVDVIDLRLNSGGGSVFDGVAIHNTLLTHRARVDVTVDGIAASIASVIAMAGDTVTMGQGTRLMIHNPMGLAVGQAADMRKLANLLDELGKDIAGFYAARGGKDVAHWLALMDAETWYSAQEAVDAGLADGVLKAAAPTKSDGAAENTLKVHDLSAFGFRYADRDQAPSPAVTALSIRSAQLRARHQARQEVRGSD